MNRCALDFAQFNRLKMTPGRGGRSLADEVVKMLAFEMPGRIASMQAFALGRRHEQLSHLAHILVGSSASIGALGLRDAALALERSARDADWARVSECLSEIASEWDALQAELTRQLNGRSSIPAEEV
jgi:HPt (histidine-containing phosphotransfer) domain-containing protein